MFSPKLTARMDLYTSTAVPKLILENDEMSNNWNEFVDAIKNIELKGPSDYEVSQNSSLAFHVDGR